MKFHELLELVAEWPVIDTRAVLAGGGDPGKLSVQLSRWVAQGRLVQLRRGMYLLSRTYRKREPEPEYLANLLVTPSYVSVERALHVHGLIPEAVPKVLSVTVGRPRVLSTAVGEFCYRSIHPALFFGFAEQSVGASRPLVARPEKALLDMVHLSTGEYSLARIGELRLHGTDRLDSKTLVDYAARFRPRVRRFAERLLAWLQQEPEETL